MSNPKEERAKVLKIKEILDNYNNKSNIKIIENAILMMVKDDDFVLNIENFQSIDEE